MALHLGFTSKFIKRLSSISVVTNLHYIVIAKSYHPSIHAYEWNNSCPLYVFVGPVQIHLQNAIRHYHIELLSIQNLSDRNVQYISFKMEKGWGGKREKQTENIVVLICGLWWGKKIDTELPPGAYRFL